MATALLTIEPKANRKLIAPLWHTGIFIAFLCGWALFEIGRVAKLEAMHSASRLPQYAFMISFELLMVGYVWFFGLRSSGTRLTELIGGRWNRWTDVLRDVGSAILLWLCIFGFTFGMHFIAGRDELSLRAIEVIAPRTFVELIAWCLVSLAAGVCEEIAFRGYLQQQFLAITGRPAVAVALQTVLFGGLHTYKGVRGMIAIAGFGVLYGIWAVRRASLRPGMIQHSGQDFMAGVAAHIILKRM
jgi:membrane protease YdiL (CAAX protease family)